MKYPSMNRGSKYRVEVPQLSGGTNMADAVQRVEDNQLTDSLNVWWHENALQTRPGLQKTGEVFGTTWTKTVVQVLNEQETFIIHWNKLSGSGWSFRCELLSARDTPSYTNRGTGTVYVDSPAANALLVRAPQGAGTDWYAILPDKVLQHTLTEGDPGEEEWTTVTDYYIPTVMVNGRGDEATDEGKAAQYEGYNRLTGSYKCSFNSDGKSKRFMLPEAADAERGTACAVTVIMADGTKKELEVAANSYMATVDVTVEEAGIDGNLYKNPTLVASKMAGDGYLHIYIATEDKETSKYGELAIPRGVNNNITVTVKKAAKDNAIGRMTRCCWFGGDRSGLAGGTRLFVCGNPEEPNLICWSDVNRPLYFPENNYAYVGDTSQPVTGFGKQGDLLMIFKESELYAAQYVAGTSYSAEDLENGKIVDVAAALAQFPLTPIHPTIGCDCPDTIRLVNNRLCWADSSGYVYMLPTVNQYNERVVREISDNIRRALMTHTKEEWNGAKACEYCGHYLLTVGRRAYLLETNNSSYASYTYYAKETTAQRLLPWYIWEFPAATLAIAGDRERVRLVQGGYAYTLAGDTDDGSAVYSRFMTKLFDFGRRQAGKGIHQLYITLADAGGTVRVSYITEDYTAEDAYTIEAEEAETPYTAGYFRLFRLSPNLHRVREFGIRCESEGTMAVAGLAIDYTMQGVVR